MTTEIKTLLQNAARAAGIEYTVEDYARRSIGGGHYEIFHWHPATDSGDSRDLQVKLKISLIWEGEYWKAIKNYLDGECVGYLNADPNMAVLLVASEIGAAMKEGV